MAIRFINIFFFSVMILTLSACSSVDEGNEKVSTDEVSQIGVPVDISDPDCDGENYQITFKDGQTFTYCLPVDA